MLTILNIEKVRNFEIMSI